MEPSRYMFDKTTAAFSTAILATAVLTSCAPTTTSPTPTPTAPSVTAVKNTPHTIVVALPAVGSAFGFSRSDIRRGALAAAENTNMGVVFVEDNENTAQAWEEALAAQPVAVVTPPGTTSSQRWATVASEDIPLLSTAGAPATPNENTTTVTWFGTPTTTVASAAGSRVGDQPRVCIYGDPYSHVSGIVTAAAQAAQAAGAQVRTHTIDAGTTTEAAGADCDAWGATAAVVTAPTVNWPILASSPTVTTTAVLAAAATPQHTRNLPETVAAKTVVLSAGDHQNDTLAQKWQARDSATAGGVYDAITAAALAISAGVKPDPVGIASVTGAHTEAAPCDTYTACLQLLQDNRNINYEGKVSRVDITGGGVAATQRVALFAFTPTGVAIPQGTVDIPTS